MDNLPKVDSKPVTPVETSSDVPAAHAGHPDVPADVREVPIETFDTPLEVAPVSPLPTEEAEEVVYEGQILAPENYSKVSTSATEAAPRLGNKFLKWLGLVAAGAGVATAAVFGAKAASDANINNEPPVTDPKATNEPIAPTSNPETPSSTSNPDNWRSATPEEVLNNPERTDSATLTKMDNGELRDFFKITTEEAPTLEDFAKQYTYKLDAYLDAGANEVDFAQYNDVNMNKTFEQDMFEKYGSTYDEETFVNPEIVNNDQYIARLNAYFTSMIIDSSKPYESALAYVDSFTKEESNTNFTIDVTIRVVDNMAQSSAHEIYPRKSTDSIRINQLKGTIVDGVYKLDSVTVN